MIKHAQLYSGFPSYHLTCEWHCSSATARLHTGLPVRCAMRYPQAATTSRRCAALNRSRIAAEKCGNFNPLHPDKTSSGIGMKRWIVGPNTGPQVPNASIIICVTKSHYVALCRTMSHYKPGGGMVLGLCANALGIHIIHRDMRPNAGNQMNMDHQPAIKTSLLWLIFFRSHLQSLKWCIAGFNRTLGWAGDSRKKPL